MCVWVCVYIYAAIGKVFRVLEFSRAKGLGVWCLGLKVLRFSVQGVGFRVSGGAALWMECKIL